MAFLGVGPFEATPDHSSLTRVRDRFAAEVFAIVRGLLAANTAGVDSSTLEARASPAWQLGRECRHRPRGSPALRNRAHYELPNNSYAKGSLTNSGESGTRLHRVHSRTIAA
jgi:hypothetical protein